MPPTLVARVLKRFRTREPRWRQPLDRASTERLTSREWQVLEMLTTAQANGIVARPEIVRDEGDRFVVDPHLPLDQRHQVFVLRDGVVSEVRAYPDRAAAVAAMELPW